MKLYFVPMTRSSRPRWVLEEIGEPYELIKLDPSKGETKAENYRKHHPLGHVPAFVDGDKTIIESAAICMYLADKFPGAHLAPPLGSPERGEYYQWIIFGHATIEPALMPIFYSRIGRPVNSADVVNAKARFREVAQVVDERLKGRQYIAADYFTAADVVMASILGWAGGMNLLHDFPRLQAYVNAQTSRPAAVRARQK